MLNSLKIKRFRALEDFSVSRLGWVNLMVGKNNAGKSTVLEALRSEGVLFRMGRSARTSDHGKTDTSGSCSAAVQR